MKTKILRFYALKTQRWQAVGIFPVIFDPTCGCISHKMGPGNSQSKRFCLHACCCCCCCCCLEQKSVLSTNPINVPNSDGFGASKKVRHDNALALAAKIGATTPTVFEDLFSKHMIYALKNQCGFDKANINRLNFQVTIPLFYQDQLIYVGSNGKIILSFNIEPNFHFNIIQNTGSSDSCNCWYLQQLLVH